MPHALSETGTTLDDKYILLGEIESNQLYSLYRAENLRPGGRVVIQLGKAAEYREAVLAAARTLASIEHPSLARVLDSGVAPSGAPYVALSALEGETLGDYVERSGLPDESEALDLARQLLGGLVACHAHGLLHGRLSPHTIGLTVSESGRPLARIHGFGHASSTPSATDWLAPEGSQTRDERADLYSVAAILLTLLGGDPAPAKPVFPSELDPALQALLLRGLSAAPGERPRSAREFLASLDALGGGELEARSVASKPVSMMKRLRQRPIAAQAVSHSLLLSPRIPPAAPAPLFNARDATFSSTDLAGQSRVLSRADTRKRTLQATLTGIAIGVLVAWLTGFL